MCKWEFIRPAAARTRHTQFTRLPPRPSTTHNAHHKHTQTHAQPQEVYSQLFSYASQRADDPNRGPDFVDDAIRVER